MCVGGGGVRSSGSNETQAAHVKREISDESVLYKESELHNQTGLSSKGAVTQTKAEKRQPQTDKNPLTWAPFQNLARC